VYKEHVRDVYKDIFFSLSISSCREVVKDLNGKQKLYMGSLTFCFKTISPNTPCTCAIGKLALPSLPTVQNVRWQSKQTHGWKHTEIKKP